MTVEPTPVVLTDEEVDMLIRLWDGSHRTSRTFDDLYNRLFENRSQRQVKRGDPVGEQAEPAIHFLANTEKEG